MKHRYQHKRLPTREESNSVLENCTSNHQTSRVLLFFVKHMIAVDTRLSRGNFPIYTARFFFSLPQISPGFLFSSTLLSHHPVSLFSFHFFFRHLSASLQFFSQNICLWTDVYASHCGRCFCTRL